MFGFEVVESASGGRAVFMRSPIGGNHHDLGLFSVGPEAPRAPRGSTGLYHLAWEVPTIDDLAGAAAILTAEGALGGASDHGVSKSLYGADPDGNEFEIMWRVPREAWGEYEHQGAVMPLDLDSEVRRWGSEGAGLEGDGGSGSPGLGWTTCRRDARVASRPSSAADRGRPHLVRRCRGVKYLYQVLIHDRSDQGRPRRRIESGRDDQESRRQPRRLLEAFYFAFGDDDVYVIVDLPGHVEASAPVLAVAIGRSQDQDDRPVVGGRDHAATKIDVGYRAPGA